MRTTRANDSLRTPRILAVSTGLVAGLIVGLSISAPQNPRIISVPVPEATTAISNNIDSLCPDEVQTLVVKALTKLEEQRELSPHDNIGNTEEDHSEPGGYGWREIQHGLGNARRLLTPVKHWTEQALREAAAGKVESSEWTHVSRLIDGVHRISPNPYIRGAAAVRDDRLAEIFIDPAYAPYLMSDDETVFVLAHELTHVAARSGKLDRFISDVAENARRQAQVEPTKDQREDLACDFIGELVLKQFVAITPTNKSTAVRISTILGYQSPSERFARAWEDFCASYDGDPGDKSHLNQHKTIRALFALDPDLHSFIPIPDSSPSIASTASGEPSTHMSRR